METETDLNNTGKIRRFQYNKRQNVIEDIYQESATWHYSNYSPKWTNQSVRVW